MYLCGTPCCYLAGFVVGKRKMYLNSTPPGHSAVPLLPRMCLWQEERRCIGSMAPSRLSALLPCQGLRQGKQEVSQQYTHRKQWGLRGGIALALGVCPAATLPELRQGERRCISTVHRQETVGGSVVASRWHWECVRLLTRLCLWQVKEHVSRQHATGPSQCPVATLLWLWQGKEDVPRQYSAGKQWGGAPCCPAGTGGVSDRALREVCHLCHPCPPCTPPQSRAVLRPGPRHPSRAIVGLI